MLGHSLDIGSQMNLAKEPIYFIGHEGLKSRLEAGHQQTMYVPDANVVLKLLRFASSGMSLSEKHKHFLSVSKQAVNFLWHQNEQWIPVNPVLALMELTKQNRTPDFKSYFNLHSEFFAGIYGIKNVAPEWVAKIYFSALMAQVNTLPLIATTIEAVYKFCPESEKSSDSMIIESVENFLDWMWKEREQLFMIGGPLTYISIYAIAGSPQARNFIKYSKRDSQTAQNVAWDMLYWLMLHINYHEARYDNLVACTSDRALAELLSSGINKGSRGQLHIDTPSGEYISAFGDFTPAKLKRLENTNLEKEILKRFVLFMAKLSAS